MSMWEDLTKLVREKITRQQRAAFGAAVITGLLAHLFFLTNILHNYDSIHSTPSGYGSGMVLGRWLLTLLGDGVAAVWGRYNLNYVFGIVTILILAAAAALVVSVFQIRDVGSCILWGMMFICFPTVASTLFFIYTAPYYALAALMAVAAVWCSHKWKRGYIGAVLLIAASLGIYQAYLTMAAGLYLLLLIYETLKDQRTIGKTLQTGVQYILTLLGGLVLYYVILQLLLRVTGISLSDYQGVSSMGQISLADLPGKLVTLYENILLLPIHDYCGISGKYVIKGCLLLLGLLSAGMYLRVSFGSPKSRGMRLLLAVMLLLFPLAINGIVIMCPEGMVYTIMVYALVLLWLIPLLLLELHKGRKGFKAASWGASLLILLAVLNYVWQANGNYTVLYYTNEQTQSYANTLVTQIRSTEGYLPDQKLAFIGEQFEDPDFMNSWEDSDFAFGGSTTNLINAYSRDEYIRNYTGYQLEKVSSEELEMLQNLEEVREMPCYPADGSIRVIDQVVVIKLQETE